MYQTQFAEQNTLISTMEEDMEKFKKVSNDTGENFKLTERLTYVSIFGMSILALLPVIALIGEHLMGYGKGSASGMTGGFALFGIMAAGGGFFLLRLLHQAFEINSRARGVALAGYEIRKANIFWLEKHHNRIAMRENALRGQK